MLDWENLADFLESTWKDIAGASSKLEDGIETSEQFFRWQLRTKVDGFVLLILIPEPDSENEISMYIEDGTDEDLVQDSVRALLLELEEIFDNTLPKKHRSKSKSPH